MRHLFDDDWKFHHGDIAAPVRSDPFAVKAGMARGGADPDSPDAAWRTVSLPHDWAIENDPAPHALPEQGSYPRGTGWYRKSFSLPDDLGDRKVLLEFEGISRSARVWVNGFFAGAHASGYTPLLCDITDFVPRYLFQEKDDPRPDGRQEVVAVRVDATETEGWWYEGCGLYRHVWLHIVDRLRFDWNGIWWTTPEVSPSEAQVCLHAELCNDTQETRDCEARFIVRNADGHDVCSATASVRIKPGRQAVSANAVIRSPELWAPDHPALYTVHAELREGATLRDTREITLGVRTFSFDANRGFILNGREMKLQGVNCHQDFAGVGVALPDRLHTKRVELLKEMGANAFRCAHNPPAPAFLEACDRLGLLVMDENRKLYVSPEGLDDLRLMIRRDRKHPSVFCWSLCNEEFAATRPLAAKALNTLVQEARALDPTRPIAFAGNFFASGAGTCAACAEAVDVVGHNYSWDAYNDRHRLFPKRNIVATEFAAWENTRGAYAEEAGRPYQMVGPLSAPLCRDTPGVVLS